MSLFDKILNPNTQNSKISYGFISARVTDIILDDAHPKFKDFGEWNGVGTIFFENPQLGFFNKTQNSIATPLAPYLKVYPLKNEIVIIFKLTSRNIDKGNEDYQFYYLNPISLWNHPHHNGYPDLTVNIKPETRRDYNQIEDGATIRRIEDESSDIDLGKFTELSNIHPLLSKLGDVIFEGRYGNAIKLGNKENKPYTIIRNGQPEDSSDEGWIPLEENINADQSIIVLSSHYSLPIQTPFRSFPALRGTPPLQPAEYFKPQIILKSGRLFFESKSDSIILNSQKHISLAANKSIGLRATSAITLDSNLVNLGGSNVDQAAIKGTDFIRDFEQFLLILKNLMESLETQNPSIISAGAGNLKEFINSLSTSNYLSNRVKLD